MTISPTSTPARPFYSSPVIEEALARLHFLTERRSRLGLLLGEAGTGKSLLLEQFARELRGQGAAVASVSLLGLEIRDLLLTIASDWNCSPAESDEPFLLWRRICDRLVELRYEQVPAIVLLDDAHAARPDLIVAVERLAAADSAADAHLTIVCASEPEGAVNLGARLLNLAELRMELAPWDIEDVDAFVSTAAAEGRAQATFDASATIRLQELSQGVPRKASQLAELAAIAGAGQQKRTIDAATVEAVYEELSVTR